MNRHWSERPFLATVALACVLVVAFVGGRQSVPPCPPCPEVEGGAFEARDASAHQVPRSGQWPAVRKRHLEAHPDCAVCRRTENVAVHHEQDFHSRPDLEIDPRNLITLCMPPRPCHLWWGHRDDYRKPANPDVREDAAIWRAKLSQ